ncbi:hypothetical protein FNAPI_7593 [Fusarium napiforme]|uniref:NACHT domain-containing protein n=1 Tax=Fusarium napiforme TaxID=42672 RepID=A0A8H5J8Q7_9HYPO|nr:hypothetical protein FNAPI_7593 [Fusarium napiforme]
MSTGIEVVGMVVALYQLINASVGLMSEFKAVCDGEPTANDHLEEHAKNLAQLCALTQAHYEAMSSLEKLSDDGKRVQKTAEKCQASAQALLGELRYVKKSLESKNCMGVVAHVVKSKVHRKKIERMDARFKSDQQELQTILQSEILSQNQAMQYLQIEEFENFEQDIQILIDQASKGFFRLEGFIEAQHKATNKIIETRLDATHNLIVHGVFEVQQRIKEHFTTAQRTEFLESFRYPEINKRYNDVLDASEACFNRVFASYERITRSHNISVLSEGDSGHFSSEASEGGRRDSDLFDIEIDELRSIDRSWSTFIEWLRSNDPLFCLRGKPGSGKSTLMKFVIDNQNTRQLLEHQGSKVIILTHFFWKIGSEEQNSIKGLLCSLIYQLLLRTEDLQELAMSRHDNGSYRSHHDWSSRALKSVLRQLLETKFRTLYIFVDGLDEVANADGLHRLTQEIEEILKFPGIKICVSSRPEALVIKWLEKLNSPSILLEDLTRPEMKSYVHRDLAPFLSSAELSFETHRHLSDEMVRKSQGVFLWLSLVLRSLIRGIQSGDTNQVLIERLAELPSELHDLYADMWDRLCQKSQVYRRDAVRFFQYALARRHHAVCTRPDDTDGLGGCYFPQPVLGQIAFAEMSDIQDILLKPEESIDFINLQELCDSPKSQIEIKCGGLLQIRMPQIPSNYKTVLVQHIEFVHRTAHDFFTDTEAGKLIIENNSTLQPYEVAACAAKGLLCLHRVMNCQHGLSAEVTELMKQIGQLAICRRVPVLPQAIEILHVMQAFYMRSIISDGEMETWVPKHHFLTYLTRYTSLHDFIVSEIVKGSTVKLATQVLQELSCQRPTQKKLQRVRLVGPLISLGADAHACITYLCPVLDTKSYHEPLARQGTAFTNILKLCIMAAFNQLYSDDEIATLVSRAITSMAATCPDLNNATLLVFKIWETGRITLDNRIIVPYETYTSTKHVAIFIEAKPSFLLAYLFSKLKPFTEQFTTIKGLCHGSETSPPKIRFIFTQDEQMDEWTCKRVSSQKRCKELVDFLFAQGGIQPLASAFVEKSTNETRKPFQHTTSLIKYLELVPYDVESAMLSLAAEKLEFCTFQEAGIVPSPDRVKKWQETRGCGYPNIIRELSALTEEEMHR